MSRKFHERGVDPTNEARMYTDVYTDVNYKYIFTYIAIISPSHTKKRSEKLFISFIGT